MIHFDHNMTNDEARAVLPYLRAARASAAKDMTKGEQVVARDNSAVAHNALSRIIIPLQKHEVDIVHGAPVRKRILKHRG